MRFIKNNTEVRFDKSDKDAIQSTVNMIIVLESMGRVAQGLAAMLQEVLDMSKESVESAQGADEAEAEVASGKLY